MKNYAAAIAEVRQKREPFVSDDFTVLPETETTMNVVFDAIRAKKPDDYTVIALRQTMGQGTVDPATGKFRAFWGENEHPDQKGNLLMSRLVHLKTHERFLDISFMWALAVREVVAELLPGEKVRCKWQNDVLVNGAKVSGHKIEFPDNDFKSRTVNVGLGVNIALMPPETAIRPGAEVRQATSLQAHNATIDIGEFLNKFDERLHLIRREYEKTQRFENVLISLNFAEPGTGLLRMNNKGSDRTFIGHYGGAVREKTTNGGYVDHIYLAAQNGSVRKLPAHLWTPLSPGPKLKVYSAPTGSPTHG